jgi:N-acetylglucosaminyl-diphospho-decaprenol L-rhamnosyltransferase
VGRHRAGRPGARLNADLSSVSVVVVTHGHREAVRRALPPLAAQLRDGDQLIVVDNASTDGTAEAVQGMEIGATVIQTGHNAGFAAGCNRGAAAASGELLVFLNPDAVPAPGFRDAIERPLTDDRGWDAWQGLVTADGGRIVNTRGGILHFTGIAWAGGAGEPAGRWEGWTGYGPRIEPGFVSGACLAIPRGKFEEAGRFPEEFFLYHEDVDLSLRLRLRGSRLGTEPEARVDHEYEFGKGPAKWRYLERNRWATVIRTYPAALLGLLAPALLATELALVPISIAGGWAPQKLLAWTDTVRALPRLLRERRAIQPTRRVSVARFARALTADLESPYLGAAARSRALRALLRSYWRVVLALLGGPRSASGA